MIQAFSMPLVFPKNTRPESRIKIACKSELTKLILWQQIKVKNPAVIHQIKEQAPTAKLEMKLRNKYFKDADGIVQTNTHGLPVMAFAIDHLRAQHDAIHYLIQSTANIDPEAPQALNEEIERRFFRKSLVFHRMIRKLVARYPDENEKLSEMLPWLVSVIGPGNRDFKKEARDMLGPSYYLQFRRDGLKVYNAIVSWAKGLTRADLIEMTTKK